MTKIECEVCYEEVAPKRVVECHCEWKACQECCKRYLLSTVQEAHCMNCKTEWSLSFLYEHFPKTWIDGAKKGQYRYHKKSIYLSIEKTKIPDTLNILEEKKRHQETLIEFYNQKKYLTQILNDLKTRKKHLNLARGTCKSMREKREILDELKAVRSEFTRYNEELHYLKVNGPQTVKHKSNFVYISPCPKEGCKGLVNQEYTCAICEIKLCRKCLREKGKEHKCEEKDVETRKMLKKDTKACPNCAVPIHRISGCPQMWCPMCKVAFDWNTGKIQTGTIHNPHALEWMRQNGSLNRNPNDVPCGGLNADVLFNLSGKDYTIINKIYTLIAELDTIIRAHDERHTNKKLLDLRIAYVNGRFNEEEWKKKVFLAYRTGDRRRAKLQIYQTLQTISIETFRELQLSRKEKETIVEYDRRIDEFYKRISRIRRFINDTFKKELTLYGSNPKKVPHIHKIWKWRCRDSKHMFKDVHLVELMRQ